MTDAPTSIRGTRDDLIWLAGLFEGEACVDAQRGKYPRIRLSMTDRDVVGRAADLMGSNVRLSYREAPASPIWNAELQGDRAAAIMSELLPYMGARRSSKIAEVLAIHHYRSKAPIPPPRIGRPFGITKPEALAA